jgi:DNA-binding CsgD family transcriptional regulator
MSKFSKDHFIIKSAGQVSNICEPLFHKFNITYFNFVRKYDNNPSKICLCNNAKWMDHFYTNELYKHLKFKDTQTFLRYGEYSNNLVIILWISSPETRVIKEQREYFNIDHGISIVFRYPKHMECFYLATTKYNNYMSNVYINNLSEIIRFTHYFKDKGEKLIATASQPENRITENNYNTENQIKSTILSTQKNEIVKIIKPNRYFLHKNNEDIIISDREMSCIELLMAGISANESAKILGISKRTVEKHVENVKQKIGHNSKGELIKFMYSNMINWHILQGSRA